MKLVFATNNPNKLEEIKAMLPDYFELISLQDIGCTEDIAETADTIEGNAQLKARYIRDHYGYDCFADDTGLEVAALGGAPGVYSARYAGPQKNAGDNIAKLLEELKDKKERKAQFKTVISLCINGKEKLFTGICEGEIIRQKTGDKGFGYDPVFVPHGLDRTFAEMKMEEKAKISHRGKAFNKLISYLVK